MALEIGTFARVPHSSMDNARTACYRREWLSPKAIRPGAKEYNRSWKLAV